MNKIFKIIVTNLIVFFLGLICLEIIFGGWFKMQNYGSLLIPRQQTNLIKDFPYKSNNFGIYSRDKFGFRANNYYLSEIDILVLGGSTTEEREVDDKKIWTKIFQNNLINKQKVLNAGIGGQTSFGHLSIFPLWLDRYDDLKPKYILAYIGINDAILFVENASDNRKVFKGRELNDSNRDTLVNLNKRKRIIQYFKNNSVFHSIYLIIKGNIISQKYQVSYNNQPNIFKPFRTEPPKKELELSQEYENFFKNYYLNNLSKINNLVKTKGSELILITQFISTNHWLSFYLKKINKYTLEFCKLKKIKCIDLNIHFKKDNNKLFYDGIHTDPSGSSLVGEFIALEFNKF